MKLEEAWNLIECLNDKANHDSSKLWATDINQAIQYQNLRFQEYFLELDNTTQQSILYWLKDDEFLDYFNSLSNNMSVNLISKS